MPTHTQEHFWVYKDWTVSEKFEIFMKGREKKGHDCISSRKFLATPKNTNEKTIDRWLKKQKTGVKCCS